MFTLREYGYGMNDSDTEIDLATVSAVIDRLGGTCAVARACFVSKGAVSNWRRRGRIPSAYWSGLAVGAEIKRIDALTVATLAAMHAHTTSERRRR